MRREAAPSWPCSRVSQSCGWIEMASGICGIRVQDRTDSLAEFREFEWLVQNALRTFRYVLVHIAGYENRLDCRPVGPDRLDSGVSAHAWHEQISKNNIDGTTVL